jgi:hypothetical protein
VVLPFGIPNYKNSGISEPYRPTKVYATEYINFGAPLESSTIFSRASFSQKRR